MSGLTDSELAALDLGVRQFNRQEFFACHETLEQLWVRQQDPERQFTQGLIQIAVAFHHLKACNYTGAAKLFARGLARIEAFVPVHRGLDVASLASAVNDNLQALEAPSPVLPAPPAICRLD